MNAQRSGSLKKEYHMNKRTIIAVAIAFVLSIGVTALWSAQTITREGDPDANIMEESGSEAGASTPEKKKGNRVARFFSAPFRAVGNLFGRGKDDGKPRRMTEKDAAKFESAPITRVSDSRTEKEKVIAISSGSAREHLATGRALLLTGRVNEAIAELSLAVSLNPKLGEANNLLGLAYDRKGMGERAKESYEKAVSIEEDAQTLNNLGYSLYQNGNYKAAVDRLKRAAKLAPGDQRILNNLALAQSRLGKYDDAYKAFARAGGELTGRLNVATMLERAGRDEEAIKHYEAALRLQPKSSVVLRRVTELYARVGRTAEAQVSRQALTNLANESTVPGNATAAR
jgi:Flp pilus assembly protein TadD